MQRFFPLFNNDYYHIFCLVNVVIYIWFSYTTNARISTRGAYLIFLVKRGGGTNSKGAAYLNGGAYFVLQIFGLKITLVVYTLSEHKIVTLNSKSGSSRLKYKYVCVVHIYTSLSNVLLSSGNPTYPLQFQYRYPQG